VQLYVTLFRVASERVHKSHLRSLCNVTLQPWPCLLRHRSHLDATAARKRRRQRHAESSVSNAALRKHVTQIHKNIIDQMLFHLYLSSLSHTLSISLVLTFSHFLSHFLSSCLHRHRYRRRRRRRPHRFVRYENTTTCRCRRNGRCKCEVRNVVFGRFFIVKLRLCTRTRAHIRTHTDTRTNTCTYTHTSCEHTHTRIYQYLLR
jgi:hypothetical protein